MPSGGAKYAADHKGGVIRLQLRRGDDRLFSGSLTLPLGVNTENGAISTDIPLTLNYTTKKLAYYTFVSGSYMQNEPTENTYSLRDQTEHTNNIRTFYSFWGDQSLVYDINKKHSIGLAINAMIKPKESSVSEVQTELSRLNEMQTSRIDERTAHY